MVSLEWCIGKLGKRQHILNDIASLDICAGDNYRYDFDYIENGYNLSFGFKSFLINLECC
jgi:hypothetical protein